MNIVSGMDKINSFFKPQNLNTSKSKLTFEHSNGKVTYERMFADYYCALFNVFKTEIPLELPDDHTIRRSNWEPLLRAGHHGFVITLKNFLPIINSKSEMGKLMGCFEVLEHHGFGVFELGLAPKGSMMKITVKNALEDSAFDLMELKPNQPVSAFTAGIVLACFNLSMTSIDISTIKNDSLEVVEKIYLESPDIKQVEFGYLSNQESGFTLHAR